MNTSPRDLTAPVPPAHVLVVDDVPQNLVAMEALLRAPGLRVLTASNAEQALELLLTHDVALALLDVQMPETDGFALAELMRGAQRTCHVPIIFLTAAPLDVARPFRGYEAGAVDFLLKPVDPVIIQSKVKVFVDLYEQRRQLDCKNAELEQLIQLQDTFSAVLTHDLRTPLSAIVMSAEVLTRTTSDDMVKATAGRITRSSRRMARMIEQLLDFSRIRSGGLRLQSSLQDLGALCSTVISEIQQARPDTRIDVTAEGDLRCHVDGDRVMQMLSNLVGNAVQHGLPQAPVQVVLDGREDDLLRVRVSNAGDLAQIHIDSLFQPFRSGAGGESSGLGLGLYIAHEFAVRHGGGLRGWSEDGQVHFELTLPRQETPAC